MRSRPRGSHRALASRRCRGSERPSRDQRRRSQSQPSPPTASPPATPPASPPPRSIAQPAATCPSATRIAGDPSPTGCTFSIPRDEKKMLSPTVAATAPSCTAAVVPAFSNAALSAAPPIAPRLNVPWKPLITARPLTTSSVVPSALIATSNTLSLAPNTTISGSSAQYAGSTSERESAAQNTSRPRRSWSARRACRRPVRQLRVSAASRRSWKAARRQVCLLVEIKTALHRGHVHTSAADHEAQIDKLSADGPAGTGHRGTRGGSAEPGRSVGKHRPMASRERKITARICTNMHIRVGLCGKN